MSKLASLCVVGTVFRPLLPLELRSQNTLMQPTTEAANAPETEMQSLQLVEQQTPAAAGHDSQDYDRCAYRRLLGWAKMGVPQQQFDSSLPIPSHEALICRLRTISYGICSLEKYGVKYP